MVRPDADEATPGGRRRFRWAGLVAWLLTLALPWACTGDVERISIDGSPYVGDYGPIPPPDDAAATPADRGLIDAPTTPGDPCPWGECGGENICVAAICRAMCVQPGCNDPVAACAANEVCLPATSFTDACFFASAGTGEVCGDGTTCLAKNVCVKTGAGDPHCYQLCKYGCNGRCVETSNGCEICLP